MDYTFNYGGMSYDLPKYTKAVKNKMDQVNKDNSGNIAEDKKYMNMYLFVKEIVGEDSAREIFGTDNVDEMDLNEILVCYLGIARSYSKPVEEAKKNNVDDEDKELLLTILKNSGNLATLEKVLKSSKTTSFSGATRNSL